ncbi:nuclear receptor subfamily 0 group B member 1-like [Brachionichthys hirsutus]|uniref:nuclear receptor subfamily 0 group B member 1-like n=1 Tax=Brachionichthys hirsutus TaxID=412623 RepID=UPI0036051EBD
MATPEGGCRCRGASGRTRNSILYSILKSDSLATVEEQPRSQQQQQHHHHHHHKTSSPAAAPAPLQEPRQQACSCGSTRRRGILRSPQVTCKAASAVLVKTLRFVKNVPCFRELPEDDQLALIRSGWAPLLVLGLAQDRVDFETTETVEPSMLQRILTGLPDRQGEAPAGQSRGAAGVSVADIDSIKAFLKKCWSVDISTKEYAYLKGAALFNPGRRVRGHGGTQRTARLSLTVGPRGQPDCPSGDATRWDPEDSPAVPRVTGRGGTQGTARLSLTVGPRGQSGCPSGDGTRWDPGDSLAVPHGGTQGTAELSLG